MSDQDFKRIPRPDGDWNDYDWSKPSRAVVASDGDNGWVIWHVGVHIEFDISEGVGSRQLEDLGMADAPKGFV